MSPRCRVRSRIVGAARLWTVEHRTDTGEWRRVVTYLSHTAAVWNAHELARS